VTPLSLAALAIIAILVLVLHIASDDMLDRLHPGPTIPATADGVKCVTEVPKLALPFD
jgi:hypothetical protein